MKLTIGDWEMNDWDGQWPAQYISDRDDVLQFHDRELEVQIQLRYDDSLNGECVASERVLIPIEVLKDLLERNGYELKEKTDGK